ncbi:MAG: Type 1 glutamine amidotransferase-like domain-containing protein [Planctomycetota bacterium]|nr:Type 1 glutamine amidotransferase-like domain-containing protein [Planctomycetota bacterium]
MLAALPLVLLLSPVQDSTEFVAPLPGSLVITGTGSVPDCVRKTFLGLAGGSIAEVVLLSGKGSGPKTKPWERVGAVSVRGLGVGTGKQLREEAVLLALLAADGLWIEEVAPDLQGDALLQSLVRGVLERGGVVGGSEVLAGAHLDGKDELVVGGLGLLQDAVVHLGHRQAKDGVLEKALTERPGSVGWGIEDETAMVVHAGRRVGAMGAGDVTALVAAHGDWPKRREVEDAIDAFDVGDIPPYDFDLLSWRRSARLRTGPVYPPAQAALPSLKRGTLILHGGGGGTAEAFERFVEAAGGKGAKFVCIPSGAEIGPGEEPDSYSADELRELGCEEVVTLHARSPRAADQDAALHALLEEADGVWIDGGRTYRVMDAYQGTRCQELLSELLARGGVVAGSSAGAQVIGDFLVRGDPRSNRTLEFEGYRQGLALLPGVIVDAHFLQRERNDEFEELVASYPQLLGIGIDEKTAIVVTGSEAEVIGDFVVTFFDLSKGKNRVELTAGDEYDLKARKKR